MKDLIRVALARLLATSLGVASRPFPTVSGTALIIAPHADDETLGCGGVIADKTARGDGVRVVFLTDSSGSHPGHADWSRADLSRQRRQEAGAALQELGLDVSRTHFLDAPDGRLDRLDATTADQLRQRLILLLQEHRPAELFLPYLGGGSTEHDAAHRITLDALGRSGLQPIIWEYPIWAWWNPLRLRRQLLRPEQNFRLKLGARRERKLRALACHRSQVLPVPPDTRPALPAVLARLCTGPVEFYFNRNPLSACPPSPA